VLTEIKNRGTADVCMGVCDGLPGLAEAVTTVWEGAVMQACVIQLLRNTFRYAPASTRTRSPKTYVLFTPHRPRPRAKERFAEIAATWGSQYPAIIRMWQRAWSVFVPFLDYDVEIRRVICSTNAIESINAHYRRAIRVRGHFPTE